MKRIVTAGMLLGMLWVLLPPLPAFAANTDDGSTGPGFSQSQPSPAGGPPARHADIDNNGISDNLQAKIAGVAANDKFDVVVTFKAKGVGNAASAQGAVGAFNLKREFSIISGFAATMTAGQVRALSKVQGVFRVEEDSLVRALLDDVRTDLDLDRIQVPGPDQIVDGLGFAATGKGVKICIIDTGLHATHVMFADRLAAGSIVWFDEVNGQPNPYDDHVDFFGNPLGHGTHVTGIALGAQSTHSGGTIPISGTAWEADIIAVKVLDSTGFGPTSTIVAGFDRCVESGADVISISLGDFTGGDCQDAMALAARAASEPPHNIFVAAAAGNSGPGEQTIVSPACEPKVTAVGASSNISGKVFGDISGTALVGFSSRGPVQGPPALGTWTKPDVVYPGVDVKSAYVNAANINYANKSGTSMSTPGVAGLAAMALQVDPALTPAEIKTLLMNTAHDFGLPGVDDDWGAGLVNPYLFMARVMDPAANPEPSPFQEHFAEESVNVAAVGNTFSQPFEVTAADVAAGTPIAMVVTIENTTPFCPGDPSEIACEFGIIGWDSDPDLDVQLHWDDGNPGTPVAGNAGDITLSDCVLPPELGGSGEFCG
ncbi:MAG: S8 family serine peptidase, partial [Alphaproteobacteria bacterium]